MRLQGKTAIITGGATGIGRATVEKFLEQGANVVFTDINEDHGRKTCDELKKVSENVMFIKHDVQAEEDWVRVVDETKHKFGRIDVLFNNAGIFSSKPIEEYTVEEWNRLMGINVTGVFLGMKHVIPVMRNQESGSIINASSIAGLKGAANHALYGASKGAVRIMTKDVAMEVAPYQVRVNSIHPGVIQTAMGEALASGVKLTTEQMASHSPMKRLGTSDDVAHLVVFLASDESTFITGAEIAVDGGSSAR